MYIIYDNKGKFIGITDEYMPDNIDSSFYIYEIPKEIDLKFQYPVLAIFEIS